MCEVSILASEGGSELLLVDPHHNLSESPLLNFLKILHSAQPPLITGARAHTVFVFIILLFQVFNTKF